MSLNRYVLYQGLIKNKELAPVFQSGCHNNLVNTEEPSVTKSPGMGPQLQEMTVPNSLQSPMINLVYNSDRVEGKWLDYYRHIITSYPKWQQ